MFDDQICGNCKSWGRNGATSGICQNDKSYEFERVTEINHVCRPPFESKF